MKPNVGGIDRAIRITLGVVLIGLSFTGVIGIWGWIIGGAALLTGLISWCPLYPLAGFNTRGDKA
ncbi:MAG TPA: DUF2892 domain-containing protein [Gammaproteobacteria bacterium]|nr:DUF2892 domain-containing protein [Gammaproteobacteria bacterium]